MKKNTNIKLGNIPKRIKIYCRPEESFRHRWDDIEVDQTIAGTKGFPAFVVDAENTKTHVTAQSWCEQNSYEWKLNPETNRQERVLKSKDWFIDERDNDPITNVRLIGLEHRGNGGRAYKVKIEDKYVFDLREDVLLDILLNANIDQGVLPGSYVFAKCGAEMKLIRVGSLLHERMVEATDYWKDEVITKFDVGGIYQNKIGRVIYLGHVYSRGLEIKWNKTSRRHWNREEFYDDYERDPISVKVFDKENKKRIHLFLETTHDDLKHINDLAYVSEYHLQFRDKLPQSYRRKVGQLSDVNPLEEVKKKIFTEEMKDFDRHQKQYGKTSPRHIAYEFSGHLPRLLNASYDDPNYVHPEVQKILT